MKLTALTHHLLNWYQCQTQRLDHALENRLPARFRHHRVLRRRRQFISSILPIVLISSVLFGLLIAATAWKRSPASPPPLAFKKNYLSKWDFSGVSPEGKLTTKVATTSKGFTVQVARAQATVEFVTPLQQPQSQVEQQKITVTDDTKLRTLEYELLPNGIKENIVLAADPQTTTFTSQLKLTNVTPYTTGQNQLVFLDKNQEYQFHFEKPYAYDAAGNTTYAVAYHLEPVTETARVETTLDSTDTRVLGETTADQLGANQQLTQLLGPAQPLASSPGVPSSGPRYQLVLDVDPTWFNSPDRQYPITIDPTVTYDTTLMFAYGQLSRVTDTGSGSYPQLETYYQEAVADDYTLALWHLNDNLTDVSGNANTGSLNGNATYSTSGLLGGSGVTLDGSGDYVSVANSTSLQPQVLTVSAWVKPTTTLNSSSSFTGFVVKNTSNSTGTARGFALAYYPGSGVVFWSAASSIWAGTNFVTDLTAGQWYHLTGTYDGTFYQLYINGQLVSTTKYANGINYDTSALWIGYINTTGGYIGFNGLIDDVSISSIVRSPEYIRALGQRRSSSVYTSEVIDLGSNVASLGTLSWDERNVMTGDGETASSSASLVAQWNFNETSGTTASVATGSCGATCNGTLTNFASTGSQDAAATSGWTANEKRWGAGALKFDGSDDYVSVTDTAALDFTGSFTSEAWVKWTTVPATGDYSIIRKNGAYTPIQHITGGSDLDCVTWPGGNLTTTRYMYNSEIATGKWYHLVCSYDGAAVKTYVNGVLRTTTAATGNLSNSANALCFGASCEGTPAEFFGGTLDAVRLYSRALPLHEIISNYNAANMEIQTRTSADGSTWEAWKSYSGEAAVESFDSSSGWATPSARMSHTWVKYDNTLMSASDTTGTNGRVPLGTAGKIDSTRIYDPRVIKDGSTYTMWYAGYNGSSIAIARATSSDGLTWTKTNNTTLAASDTTGTDGRIPLGTNGTGDDVYVYPGAVLKDGSTYKMWYTGFDGSANRVYYATSSDGLTWTKVSNTTATDCNDTCEGNGKLGLGAFTLGDDAGLIPGTVLLDGGTYKMWYSGYDGGTYRIYYATSPDGLTWTKDSAVPSADCDTYCSGNGRLGTGSNGRGDDAGLLHPIVIKDGSTYRMWYNGLDGATWRTYYATSPDGLTWHKYDNTTSGDSNAYGTNGRLGLGSSGRADSGSVNGITVVQDENKFKMWYGQYVNSNHIVHATMDYVYPSVSAATDTTIKTEGTGSLKVRAGGPRTDPSTMAYWTLDETSGSGAYLKDTGSATSGDHATPTGTTVVDGVVGKARSFNGTSDYLEIPDSTEVRVGTPAFTFEAWLNPSSYSSCGADGTPTCTIYNKENSSVVTISNTGKLHWALRNTSPGWAYVNTGVVIPLNTWTHLTLVSDGANVIVYINGQPVELYTATGSVDNTNYQNALRIGARNAPSAALAFFAGKMDEISFSKRAKSATEILENFRLGRDYTVTKTISSTDLSGKTSLPFSVAADKPGAYIQATTGESAYATYEPDANTVGLWHFDENGNNWGDTFNGSTIDNSKWIEYDPNADKISQSNGLLLSAGTAAAWDSGVISQQKFPVEGGLRLYAKFTTGSSVAVPNYSMIGFGQDQTASGSYDKITHALYLSSGSITVYQDGVFFGGSYGSYVANTTYEIGITVNGTGTATYQIKGGTFTNWTTLLAADNAKVNTPLRAQVAQYRAGLTYSEISVSTGEKQLIDSSGYNNHGQLYNAKSLPGKVGLTRNFNGSHDTVIVQPSSSLNFTQSNPFSLEAWVKPQNTGTQKAIINKQQNVTDELAIRLLMNTNDQISFNLHKQNSLSTYVTSPALAMNKWHHVVAVSDATNIYLYINGQLVASDTISFSGSTISIATLNIGKWYDNTYYWAGDIDEVRISNSARSATEVKQAYEAGLRSHTITIDFAASLNSSHLITDSTDKEFAIDVTGYGTINSRTGLYVGDKIIIKENVNGTEYLAQGDVAAVGRSSAGVIVSSWDSGSTFPTGGYTANATVFKWQREYLNFSQSQADRLNATTNLSLRILNGYEGRTMYFDDLRSNTGYLTTPAGSTPDSTRNRYFQYRIISSSADPAVAGAVRTVTLSNTTQTGPATPTLGTPAVEAIVSTTPTLTMSSTDADSDYLRYKIEVCTDLAMTTGCVTANQTTSQTGWSGQDAQTSTAYASGTTASYTFSTPFAPSYFYYWRVYAIDPAGTNVWSGTQTARQFNVVDELDVVTTMQSEGQTNPTAVTDTTPEFTATYLDSNGLYDGVYYQIQVNTQSDFRGTQMWDSGKTAMTATPQNTTSPSISYAGQTLNYDNKTYYWRIRFWNTLGSFGQWSSDAVQSSFTMANMLTPQVCTLQESPANSSIIVNWSNTSDVESNFEIERSVNGGGFSALTSPAANAVTYTDSTVSSGNTYQYRVRASLTSPATTSDWCTTATLSLQTASFRLEGLGLEGVRLD